MSAGRQTGRKRCKNHKGLCSRNCTCEVGAKEGSGRSASATSSTSTGSGTNLSLTRGPGAGCIKQAEHQLAVGANKSHTAWLAADAVTQKTALG